MIEFDWGGAHICLEEVSMSKVSRRLLLAAIVVALGGIFAAGRLDAQPAGAGKGEAVKITTIDGVDLHATFFASPKKDAPTVILLHAIGETGGHSKNYISLAQTLQPNYSVMTFDFRGHGKSKDIDPMIFRKFPLNQSVKGNPKGTTIEYGDFPKSYYPVLCNDIAAVKAYLDRKNDTGACNTSSTILIGAETGATLGAIWSNAQWALYRLIPNALAGFPPQINKDSEGKDVIACVWLSIPKNLGSFDLNLAKTLNVPVRVNATATVFIYGDEDGVGKSQAIGLEKSLKEPNNQKFRFVTSYAVNAKTKLKGMKLLFPQTNKDIAEYLDQVVEKKAAESVKRDFRTTDFVWRLGGPPIAAKTRAADMNNFLLESYDKFMGR
jgi:predicted esterase